MTFVAIVALVSAPGTLRLRGQEWPPGAFAIMAVVNRTPDSFFDQGATFGFDAALASAHRAVAAGAQIVDIGGVKAGPGAEVTAAQEIDRVAGLVAALRQRHPDVVISVDTWRAEVAAAHGLGLVCAHAGPMAPRTGPHRPAYADVVQDVITAVTTLAGRAAAAGVPRESILIDPAHDFGKTTWHSLEITRRLGELCGTGWPVLVALSNKDFVGESLGLPIPERGEGTIAALAISAWQGARVFRVHDVPAARRALDVVAQVQAAAAESRFHDPVKKAAPETLSLRADRPRGAARLAAEHLLQVRVAEPALRVDGVAQRDEIVESRIDAAQVVRVPGVQLAPVRPPADRCHDRLDIAEVLRVR